MAITTTWTDPDDLDLAINDVLLEDIWDKLVSNLKHLGGDSGNATPNWFSDVGGVEGGGSSIDLAGGWTNGRLVTAGADLAGGNRQVSRDFQTLTAVYIAVWGDAAGTIDWTMTGVQAIDGEAKDANTDSATANGTAVAQAQVTEIDVTGAFDGLGLAAGDYVGWNLDLDAKDTLSILNVVGVRFEYAK